ncbi:MAG: universal stress protein [Nitriliruptoraceae bacterium]
MGTIIVGVDGSDGSRSALQWAARQAALTGSTLTVITTYEVEISLRQYVNEDAASPEQIQAIRDQLDRANTTAQDNALDLITSMTAGITDVEVTPLAVARSRPAEYLIQQSADADLLVVGSRGRGGFSGLLLGSVSQQCAAHARCPVVIVHED